jgi:betaine-aldehyde dehydrogenase
MASCLIIMLTVDPFSRALWKSAPCLAAGNTMVYKPSEVTSMHAQVLADIYTAAGVPPGVFNVVYGAGDIGGHLTSHPGIAKVSFTGQVSTGKKVAGSAAGNMKSITMELGGKSALIVLPDADVDNAIDGAMMANFFSTGQVCTNGTRVFVPETMKATFEEKLLGKMEHVRLGDPMNEMTNFGPLISQPHYEKVVGYVNHGIKVDKARLLYGGPEKPKGLSEDLAKGYWIRPTIFTDCTDSMKIVKEEIFGPVLSILSYTTVEEAVRRANKTNLGLAAGVFGTNMNLAHKVIAQLEAGITWINTWGESPAEMSVGGWKQSGVGVENGRGGIDAWVRNKSTLVDMSGVVSTVFSKL